MKLMEKNTAYISSIFVSRKLVLLFLCCYTFSVTFCQSSSAINSKQPHETIAGSSIADTFNVISKKYWLKNLDSSVYYAQKALQLSQRLDYKKGIAESYRNIGVTNRFIGDKNISKQYLQKALAIFTSLADQRGMSATYNNLGVLYTDLSEFNISLNYLDSALMLFRKIKDSEGEGSVLNYIGINYQEQGNYQKAIDYCLQGFELRKKIKDHPGVVFSLINVGNMYFEVGQPQTALNFYNQSVTYAQEHNMDPFDYSLNQIGKTYLKLKQYAKAETYLIRKRNLQGMPVGDPIAIGDLYSATGKFDSAITQFKINLAGNNYSAKALSLAGLSKVFLKEGKYELAGNYAQQAYLIADSAGNKLILADVAGVLAAFYKTNGDYNKALQFFELAHSVTDSISGENYQRKLAFTESKSEIENEQARVKLLLRDKELQEQKLKEGRYLTNFILILLGIFAMAIFLSIFIIRNINSKRKKIQSQKDVIELQSVKVEKAY